MTREAKVGLTAVAAVVGFIGWSVAEGVANRPKPADVPKPLPQEEAVAVVAPASTAPKGESEHACCKDKASHSADHANCKMHKKAEPAAAPKGDAAKCPYLSGKTAAAQEGSGRVGGPQS